MNYFTPEFLKFFRGLKKKNNKAWFDANKKWYEEKPAGHHHAILSRRQKHERLSQARDALMSCANFMGRKSASPQLSLVNEFFKK
ncbi:DUF2461 domain-containing protein [candidate division KSB1 bacterium]|nr:DUF2461 domain-containing protein [candidate division KSB1 bacterium]